MRAKLKPLAGQVVVVSGPGSRLSLEVARLATKAGAAVVLADRDEAAVRNACDELGKAGGRVHPAASETRTVDGAERVARIAEARFGRIDSWIETTGDEAAQASAAQALVRHISGRAEPGALVVFGRRIGRSARAELRPAKGRVVVTLIKLPLSWGPESPAKAAAQAALHAAAKPIGEMALATKGQGLTAATEVRKHPGVAAGVGLLAVAGIALWFGRGRIAQAAGAVGPRIARVSRRAPPKAAETPRETRKMVKLRR